MSNSAQRMRARLVKLFTENRLSCLYKCSGLKTRHGATPCEQVRATMAANTTPCERSNSHNGGGMFATPCEQTGATMAEFTTPGEQAALMLYVLDLYSVYPAVRYLGVGCPRARLLMISVKLNTGHPPARTSILSLFVGASLRPSVC